MIRPGRAPAREDEVGGHYDALDRLYRDVWGEHVHHGLWSRDRPRLPARLAVLELVDLVDACLRPPPAARLLDIGCGFAATARLLAARHAAEVTGFTLSGAQAEGAAAARPPARGRVEVRVRSWLDAGLPEGEADGAYAIESIAHMDDKPGAFAAAARALRPGGRLVVVDWLAAPDAGAAARRLLLEPICREGRLPSLATPEEYAGFAEAAGLRVDARADLTARAARTWDVVIARGLPRLVTDAGARRLLLRDPAGRDFLRCVFRMPVAMRTRALRLALLVAEKPA